MDLEKQKALDKLTEAVRDCQNAGIKIGIAKMHRAVSSWAIFLGQGYHWNGWSFIQVPPVETEKNDIIF